MAQVLGSVSKEETRLTGKTHVRLWLYPFWFLVLIGLTSLGLWQLDRAEQKRAWLEEQKALSLNSPSQTEIGEALKTHRWVATEMSVNWLEARPLFLDNRTHEGRAGYELLLPVQLEDGSILAANLGWLPAPSRRDVEPEVNRPQVMQLSGVIGLPVETFTLGGEQSAQSWLLQRQRLETMEQYWQLDLQPWIFWLDQPVMPGIKARLPGAGQMPPERHIGYAVQWFALALTLLLLGGVLEWKIRRKQHHV